MPCSESLCPLCSQVSGVLSELHVQVREIVGRACEDTLAQHGFVPDPLEDPAEDMEGERIQCIYPLL